MLKKHVPFNPVRILNDFPKIQACVRAEKDILVLSHLRWNSLFKKPQNLMTRLAQTRRVFYFEEPIWVEQEGPSYKIEKVENDIKVVIPVLPKLENELLKKADVVFTSLHLR